MTHYRGELIDGTVFDSSYDRRQPVTFAVNRVIGGWTEALQLMKVGGKARITSPAARAYGDRGTGSVPPGAALSFEVELIAVND